VVAEKEIHIQFKSPDLHGESKGSNQAYIPKSSVPLGNVPTFLETKTD